MPREAVRCDHTIRQERGERKLIINCKECDNDLSMECLSGVILSLEKEFNVSTIVLSDYIERQYSGVALEIIEDIKNISKELEGLASRDTRGKNCKKCGINPAKMYPELKSTLLLRFDHIFNEFIGYSKELMTIKGCTSCRRSTKEELALIGNELLRLRSKVILEAYGILS